MSQLCLWTVLTLLALIPACGPHRQRADPSTQAQTRCESVASLQESRFHPEKFDQEIYRRLPSQGAAGPEEFWRDTFFKGQPLTSTKLRCLEDEAGLRLFTLDKIDHRTQRLPLR